MDNKLARKPLILKESPARSKKLTAKQRTQRRLSIYADASSVFSEERSSLDRIDNDDDDKRAQSLNKNLSAVFQLIAIVSCIMCVVFPMGFSFCLNVLYAQLIREFDEDRSVVVLISSIYNGLMSTGAIFWGYPLSKLGYGYCIAIGGVIGSTAIIASSFAPNVPTIIVLSGVITGLTFGMVFLGSYVVVGQISDKYNTVYIALMTLGSSVGQIVTPSLTEILIEEYGWNGVLLLIGAICMNSLPAGLIIHIVEKTANKNFLNVSTKSETSTRDIYKLYLFKDPTFCIFLTNALILSFIVLPECHFLVDIGILRGFERKTGTLFLTMIGVGQLLGGMTGPASKIFCKLSSSGHLAYWILITAITHVFVLFFDTYVCLLATSIINGLCVSNIYAHLPVAIYEIYGEDRYASALTILYVFKGTGSFLGGFLSGVISDKTGSYDLLFEIAVGLCIYFSISCFAFAVYCNRHHSK